MDRKIIFRALGHRNYRLFFCGQGVSLIGTWMQYVAMSWLVYRLTGSAMLLGLVGFAGQIPAFLLGPIAGVIADRYNRHRILIVTQALAMFQALVLSLLVLTGHIAVWHIFVLSLWMGIVNAIDIPVRQAFTVEMIDKREYLANAIALNSSMFNIARLVGPSIGGIIISIFGEGICFLLNALSYIAIIWAYLSMKLGPEKQGAGHKHIFHELKDGFNYAFKFPPIRMILLLLGLISIMGVPAQVLMPVFVKDIFHGGPRMLGFLMAMSGIGALGGAIHLAGRKSIVGLVRVLAIAAGVFGLGLVMFSFSKTFWVSMLLLLGIGFSMMIHMASCNTILQNIVEEDMRGRVMSFYSMAFIGMAPFGSLLAGALASRIGAPGTVFFGGVATMVGAALFLRQLPLLRTHIRPIYVKKGILTAEDLNR